MQFSKNKNASEQKRCIMDSKSLMKGKKCHLFFTEKQNHLFPHMTVSWMLLVFFAEI